MSDQGGGTPYGSGSSSGTKPPFLRGGATGEVSKALNLLKNVQERKIGDMTNAFDSSAITKVPARVRELSVKDLNDLASEFSGVPTNNPKVQGLTVEEINGIEFLFTEYRAKAINTVATASAEGAPIFDNWSCCCCTPCCCCAAADVDPFDA